MKFAIDFDNTIVESDTAYDDLVTPLRFKHGAKEGILALKRAGHTLILWSTRANLSLRDDWQHNPLWANDPNFDVEGWEASRALNQARFQQMVDFVEKELPGVFSIDYGNQGKVSADVYLDDKAMKMNGGYLGATWDVVKKWYGESNEQDDPSAKLRVSDGQKRAAVPRRSRIPTGR